MVHALLPAVSTGGKTPPLTARFSCAGMIGRGSRGVQEVWLWSPTWGLPAAQNSSSACFFFLLFRRAMMITTQIRASTPLMIWTTVCESKTMSP